MRAVQAHVQHVTLRHQVGDALGHQRIAADGVEDRFRIGVHIRHGVARLHQVHADDVAAPSRS